MPNALDDSIQAANAAAVPTDNYFWQWAQDTAGAKPNYRTDVNRPLQSWAQKIHDFFYGAPPAAAGDLTPATTPDPELWKKWAFAGLIGIALLYVGVTVFKKR